MLEWLNWGSSPADSPSASKPPVFSPPLQPPMLVPEASGSMEAKQPPAVARAPSGAVVEDDSVEKAKETLAQAALLEKQGKNKQALDEYHSALKLLVAALKEAPEPRKRELRKLTERYMSQAESLKDRMKEKDRKLVPEHLRSQIESNIISTLGVSFDQVIGLDSAKQALHEMVILPALRPDLFTGLRRPPRCLLLFGPPGNGKTFIARALAAEAQSTFFCISAASLVSSAFGEGEKLVRALFHVARERQPSIIFFDELDSLLTQRKDDEHEASRRMKTEFLIQLDGAQTSDQDRVVVIGATNLPDQLDDAVVRRFTRRVYISNPDTNARKALVLSLLKGQRHSLSDGDMKRLMDATDGYSNSDLTALCKEAALVPMRLLDRHQLRDISHLDIPPISLEHFQHALRTVTPSLSREKLVKYARWDSESRSR